VCSQRQLKCVATSRIIIDSDWQTLAQILEDLNKGTIVVQFQRKKGTCLQCEQQVFPVQFNMHKRVSCDFYTDVWFAYSLAAC
jgi:hypothetical protein